MSDGSIISPAPATPPGVAGLADAPLLEISLLGPLTLRRAGVPVALPASRKARALLAYLALAPRPVMRGQLCELLWDVPDDPRGELRWCLSKIRGVIDEPGRRRLDAQSDMVRLDLADCSVDAAEVAQALREGVETLAPEQLERLAGLFAGDLLDGLEIDRSPAFSGWLVAQRRRFRDCRIALLERLAQGAPDDRVFGYLDQWLQLAPFDTHPHELLLAALARRGRMREAEEHLAAATRLFQAEGLDSGPLRALWGTARARPHAAPRAPAMPPQAAVEAGPGEEDPPGPRRAAIAVMPFLDLTGAQPPDTLADGLAYDLISRLAKLRSLFVIAQGTVFALRQQRVAPDEAGRMLAVDFVVSGTVQRRGGRLAVAVELAEARSARVVWAEIFDQKLDDALLVLDEIGNRMVASIAAEIEAVERNRAVLKPPGSLDAWEAHHRGLWHMYRFNKPDNDRARHFFETAIRLDPTFSRAHAGLSFTHWQNAFQGWEERDREVERAYAAAGQSLMADDRDPAAHCAMGRALWLRGRHAQSVEELRHSVELSPNFALGHYTLAFVHSLTGDPAEAVAASDRSRRLSPFDPMLFGMLGTRAMALARLGRFEEAAEAGVQAAARPNAHAHIAALAAFSLSLAGRLDEAQAHLAAIRRKQPRYGFADFLAAMRPMPDGERVFRAGAQRIGLA
jgi:DNA-binding SARP family transcriptional activator/TolB-like protein